MSRLSSSRRPRIAAAFLLFGAALAASPAAASGDDIFGTWMRDDGNARVRVAPCGSLICATNVWIRDAEKQGEKVGDRLEFKIKREGDEWRGSAYDPQRKLSFSATLSASGQTMTTGGCVAAVLCKTTNWSKVQGVAQ